MSVAAGAITLAVLLVGVPARADERDDLRTLIEQQQKQIEELKRRLDALTPPPNGPPTSLPPAAPAAANDPAKPQVDPDAVKKIVADYLKDNPGAGMPASVQTGFETGKGFVIRSTPDPKYVKWDNDCRIPFELRIHGRIQFDYYRYKVTENQNNLTGQPATQDANATRLADYSQLEVKRANLIFEGSVYDPDLHYRINLNGFARGLPGFQNNKVIQTVPAGGTAPNGSPVSPVGGAVTVDHAVTLFEAYTWYDFHGPAREIGYGDCADGPAKYAPTYTLIAGKMKPFFGLDETLGNANMQFVEFSMANFFFDADDDSRLDAAGFQIKHLEDRLFFQALITNGSSGTFNPNPLMDDYPGFISGVWYDFGGSWNAERKAWDLFGDSISDIDDSPALVVRVGGCVNLVPMDRRSLYGDAEQARYSVTPGGPGGTRLINLLNGDLATPAGSHAVDEFDAYTYTVFAAAHYKGFSLHNEWWLRNLTGFRTSADGLGNIVYQDTLGPGGASRNALFPANHGLVDAGMELSSGYFLIPKKLEICARWSWVSGQSGDINGDGTFHTVKIPGLATPVDVVDGAFHHFRGANEYTVGINYYWKRQLLKWQTDVGLYEGGNPAAGGQSLAGYIAGADGYLVRTQVQLAF
jgi:hypothetical protein